MALEGWSSGRSVGVLTLSVTESMWRREVIARLCSVRVIMGSFVVGEGGLLFGELE